MSRRQLFAAAFFASLAGCGQASATAAPMATHPATPTAAASAPASETGPTLPAPSPTAAANVPLPFFGHTATLLLDGRVLVAGGATDWESRTPIASAELYDPGTNQWSTTGTMRGPRSGHAAVLLADGQVLVAGGMATTAGDGLATAELYDPASGEWTPTGSMVAGEAWLAATRLGTGDVLAISQNHAELFDHDQGTWSETSPWASDRGNLSTLTTLADGTALAAGGGQQEGCAITAADVFDPRDRSWVATGRMAVGHIAQSAVLLHGGQVLAIGEPCDPGPSAELYNPRTRTWAATGSLHAALGSVIALSSGEVLALGAAPDEDPLSSVERFDPARGAWTDVQSLHTARAGHTATLLPNGTVLVVGGDDFVERATVELYDPSVGP